MDAMVKPWHDVEKDPGVTFPPTRHSGQAQQTLCADPETGYMHTPEAWPYPLQAALAFAPLTGISGFRIGGRHRLPCPE